MLIQVFYNKMKKILDIINIDEATQCHTLQMDYKIERKNLKRYQQSLKLFKVRFQQILQNFSKMLNSLHCTNQNQRKSRKKISEIQYFMYNGIKVFETFHSLIKKNYQYYHNLYQKTTNMLIKVQRCLLLQKRKYEEHSQFHKKQLKFYASQCYPQTTSILFIMNLVSPQKIQKQPDSFRQNIIIQSSKQYSTFLKQCLKQMQSIKVQILAVTRTFIQGTRNIWVQQLSLFITELSSFSICQDQINHIAESTGRVFTDRSNKSNDDATPDHQEQQLNNDNGNVLPQATAEQ